MRPDYIAAVRDARTWLRDPNTIILDTETTDLDGYLVEIAAINVAGDVLMDLRLNPQAPISPKASAIHGHTAETLADAPTFAQIAEQLDLIAGRRVVIYNVGFDKEILRNELHRWQIGRGITKWDAYMGSANILNASTWNCAMRAYSDYIGDWNNYHGNNRWQPLPGGDHSALGDCRATLAVLKQMAEAANKAEL